MIRNGQAKLSTEAPSVAMWTISMRHLVRPSDVFRTRLMADGLR